MRYHHISNIVYCRGDKRGDFSDLNMILCRKENELKLKSQVEFGCAHGRARRTLQEEGRKLQGEYTYFCRVYEGEQSVIRPEK